MTIATLFFVLNPAAVAVIWLGYRHNGASRERGLAQLLPVVAAAVAALALAVLVGAPLLDALDVSDATFRIAAGTLVVFGALQAFLGFGLRHALATRMWLVVAALVWLAAPPAAAAAVAIRLDDGVAAGLMWAAAGVVVATGLGFLWTRYAGDGYPLVLGVIRRVLAAGAVFGGVDLIRQGVLSI